MRFNKLLFDLNLFQNAEIYKYCWIQDERMIADVLTKEKKEKFGLDDLMKLNRLDVLKNEEM